MMISEVKELYSEYVSKVKELEQQMKPSDGLFGMGRKISDDRCHDDFADRLEKMLSDYAESEHDKGEVREVLGYIYNVPFEFEDDKNIYWMMNAVHGLTQNLISFLSAEDADRLLKEYKDKYPRSKRLPVQKQLVKALEKRIKSP